MEAGGPCKSWECFALHYSDKNLKIAGASITPKLAKHCNVMSKTSEGTYPALLMHASFLRQHEELENWSASGSSDRLMWACRKCTFQQRQDLAARSRLVQSLHPCPVGRSNMSWLLRLTSWVGHGDAVSSSSIKGDANIYRPFFIKILQGQFLFVINH